jgi:hypothetical protein
MKGKLVQCAYADNGTGRVIRRQSNIGWIVEYRKMVATQDFMTGKITTETHVRTRCIKNDDIVMVQ